MEWLIIETCWQQCQECFDFKEHKIVFSTPQPMPVSNVDGAYLHVPPSRHGLGTHNMESRQLSDTGMLASTALMHVALFAWNEKQGFKTGMMAGKPHSAGWV